MLAAPRSAREYGLTRCCLVSGDVEFRNRCQGDLVVVGRHQLHMRGCRPPSQKFQLSSFPAHMASARLRKPQRWSS